jgi:ATP-dependent Zn protease
VRAQEILSERRASLDAVIELLLEKETISGVELTEVVRRSIDAAEPAALSR